MDEYIALIELSCDIFCIICFYFADQLQDEFNSSLCIRYVPRFESGRPERGWVSHGTAEEMQFQWFLLLDNKPDRV